MGICIHVEAGILVRWNPCMRSSKIYILFFIKISKYLLLLCPYAFSLIVTSFVFLLLNLARLHLAIELKGTFGRGTCFVVLIAAWHNSNYISLMFFAGWGREMKNWALENILWYLPKNIYYFKNIHCIAKGFVLCHLSLTRYLKETKWIKKDGYRISHNWPLKE